jgi:hypothetical protein
MATTKKTTRKSGSKISSEKLITSYVEFVLGHGVRPPSVYKFCQDLGINEEEFYNHVGSFSGLEKLIWKGYIDRVIGRLLGDNDFQRFTVREKVLTFYFSLLEELKQHRSYVLFQLENSRKLEIVPDHITSFKSSFESFFDTILQEGKSTGEVANRPILDKRYPQLFWLHMGFILMFWKEDNSAGFEKTDAAVEKSVNLAFDLIGKGAVDSAIDFAKFMYQSKP